MSGCEERLLKLKQYVPFLQRRKDGIASSHEESLKISQLIQIITSSGDQ